MKLYYFDIYGKGEAARILLHTAKVEYEDVRYSFEEWGSTHKKSGKFEFEQLPDLELDGHMYAQSQAILRLLGKRYGYYPENPIAAWQVDSTLDANADITNASYKYLLENDEEKKKAAQENFVKNVFPQFAAILEKRIAANSSKHHLVGESLTIADFAIGAQFYSIVLNEASPAHKELTEILNQHPTLKDYIHHLGSHHFKEYLASRPTPRPF